MNAPETRIIAPAIGTMTEHGFHFARIRAAGTLFALFQPPMATARKLAAAWNGSHERVADAYSFSDGHANTLAMAKAGSRIAQAALDLGLHIPSLDESDLQYRAFKPTDAPNWCFMRSGINLNAETPLEPYTPEFPKQTEFADYRAGGPEAFPAELLWTSTQDRGWDDDAWAQGFSHGGQYGSRKSDELPVVLVRRLAIR